MCPLSSVRDDGIAQRQKWGKVGVYQNDQPERFRPRTVPGPVLGVYQLPAGTTFVPWILSPTELFWSRSQRGGSIALYDTKDVVSSQACELYCMIWIPYQCSTSSSWRTIAVIAISRGTFCFQQLFFDVAEINCFDGS